MAVTKCFEIPITGEPRLPSLMLLLISLKNGMKVPAQTRMSFYIENALACVEFYVFFQCDSNHVTFMLYLPRESFLTGKEKTWQVRKTTVPKCMNKS